jgi:hypothetical protein
VTTHLQLVPGSRKRRSIHPLPIKKIKAILITDNRLIDGGEVVNLTRRPRFTLRRTIETILSHFSDLIHGVSSLIHLKQMVLGHHSHFLIRQREYIPH